MTLGEFVLATSPLWGFGAGWYGYELYDWYRRRLDKQG